MNLSQSQLMKISEQEEEHKKQLQIMKEAFNIADIFINRYYLDSFSQAEIWESSQDIDRIKSPEKLCIYKISKLILDKNEDTNDKLTSVYNSLYNLAISVAILIVGTETKVDYYFLTRSEILTKQSGEILESSLRGNFPGIDLEPIPRNEIPIFLKKLETNNDHISLRKSLATVSIIPSIRNKEKKEQYVQGMEKLVDTLRGKCYIAFLLGTPLSSQDIKIRKNGYEEIYSALTPYSKLSVAYGENFSNSINKGLSKSFTKSVNDSISDSNSNSKSNTSSHSAGSNSGFSSNGSHFSFSSGSSSSNSNSYTSGVSFSHTISQSIGISEAQSINEGKTLTSGISETKTLNFENKSVSNLMKKIDDQLERIKICESYGLWESCAYFFSNDIGTSILAATTYKSIMAGEKTGVENTHVNVWTNTSQHARQIERIFDNVKYLLHPCAVISTLKDYNGQGGFVTPTNLVSGSELSFLLGMPRKSIPGMAVQEMAEFGRSVIYEKKYPERTISIGNIYHMGVEDNKSSVTMDLNLFSSHCFITGSSGSGKSYATYNLLDQLIENGIKILIIEPAKGEYKTVLGNLNGIKIYTTELNRYKLLRINPFQFPEQIHILSHIEQLMQIFGASWSLYDAMPAILKESIIKSYIDCGWDIQNSVVIPNISERKYPLFSDVLDIIPYIIDNSDYSDEIKGNYKGALITRLKSMTTGLNGLIFENDGIQDEILFNNNVIIDLSDVGSEETIALIMGTIIMKLNEYRKSCRKAGEICSHDSDLTHVTVLEEAHNLLKRTNKEQSQDGANMIGKSVTMISNSIKEMRTYGEGFLIIDQSPLAVDSSVIENTSTKIIMNTPSKEACDVLGSALSLNERQTKELSRLNVGVAAVMQKGWMSPVLLKIGHWNPDKYEAPLQIDNLSIRKFIKSALTSELCRQIIEKKFSSIPLSEIIYKSNISKDQKEEFLEIISLFNKLKSDQIYISEQSLGLLFIEIIGCKEIFEIIPYKNLYDSFINSADDSLDEEEEYSVRENIYKYTTKWISLLKKSLSYYVKLNQENLSIVVYYVLAYKKGGRNDISVVCDIIHHMINTKKIDC